MLKYAGFSSVPNAEVNVTTIKGDNGLPSGLVATVGRDARARFDSHGVQLRKGPNPVVYRVIGNQRAALPTIGR